MSTLILSEHFTVHHAVGAIKCLLVLNGTGCTPISGPFYFGTDIFDFDYPVLQDCCRFDVKDFAKISGNMKEQRLDELRLRQSIDHIRSSEYTPLTNFECFKGECAFFKYSDTGKDSSDLITFTLIIVFFCCWVQWSLHLTEHIKSDLQQDAVFVQNELTERVPDETVPNKLAHYDKILKSFGIVVLDVIWYVAWDKIDTLSSTPDFYDDTLEDMIGPYNIKMYCRGLQHGTLLIALYLTLLVLAEQDALIVPDPKTFLEKIAGRIKRFANRLFDFCRRFFGNTRGNPRVQLTIRWLLEVLLLNAVTISVPWRLGTGIRRVVSFGSGCTIAFITGRDGFMLKTRFGLAHKQQLGIMIIILIFLVHSATFMVYPLFATSMTLLNRHALVIALSLTTQIMCVGKMFS